MVIKYVTLDPTGNITCLVLSPVAVKDRPRVTARLMDRCEQVGYLLPASQPGAWARLEMMGGEFCGNASMGSAAWLARKAGLDDQTEAMIPLEVSGAEGIVSCRIRREGDSWLGTVNMPLPEDMAETELDGKRVTAVFLPGMTHLILPQNDLSKKEAEVLLRKAASRFSAPALGLLLWDSARAFMTPLVYVRGSKTMVWENACGSGTTAIACWIAGKAGYSLEMAVGQPGGIMRTAAEIREGVLREIRLSGTVRIGAIAEIEEDP